MLRIMLMSGLLISTSLAGDLQILTLEEPLFGFTNSDNEFTGFSVDVIHEIQRRVGNDDKIQVYPWKRAFRTAIEQPNVVLFTVTRTADREEKFHWIATIERNAWALFAKKGSGIVVNTLDDAKKVNLIGVLRGGSHEQFLLDNGFKREQLIDVSNYKQSTLMLHLNRIELTVFSTLGMAISCFNNNCDFNEFEAVFTFKALPSGGIAMSKGTPAEVVEKWQKAARDMKEDGTFEAIAKKWVKYVKKTYGLQSHVKDGTLNLWPEE